MNKTVGVLGCGWLGLPLARLLIDKGYTVHGTTTSESKVSLLKVNGIEPHLISLGEASIEGDIASFLKGVDCLVVNVPPALRKGNASNYVEKIKRLHEQISISGIPKVIFVSSTSVYGAISGKVTEQTAPNPDSESGRQLLQAEDIFSSDQNLRTSIIRFGGLIGPGRHPVNFLSGRKDLKNGKHPVNLIHLEDCLDLILTILKKDWWDMVFNGVFPEHPTKQDYYTLIAQNRGLQAPEYKDESNELEGKIIESTILAEKGFTFHKGIWG